MRRLVPQKEEATRLRRKGLSYKEILKVVPVAKSTLSEWLQKMPLTEAEKSILKRRKDSNISLGRVRAAAALHSLRADRDEALRKVAQAEFEKFHNDPFFYVGLSLYWGEGAKRNDLFAFTNSDSEMMMVVLAWIERFFGVQREDVRARLYIHKPYAHENCEGYWSRTIRVPLSNFRKTIYKPTGLLVKKRPNYMGCLRIEIGGVSYLRKYLYWQNMMLEDYKKQGYC
jgi:hypothetical protein